MSLAQRLCDLSLALPATAAPGARYAAVPRIGCVEIDLVVALA